MAAKFCSYCQQSFPTAHTVCPHDQTVLSLPDPYQMIGRTLLEKYRVEALVGLGGMGAVYCAYHTGLDRRVAFKILQPNIAVADEHLVELFEREAKVAGRLSHQNIVDVRDAGRTPDGTAYIVMEWLEGRTLDEELRAQGALSFARAGEILRQITAALAEAHSKQVVHRDLKPANVMLVRRSFDGEGGREIVKVLDFGIGKILTETGASVSAVMGTPSYASPEQLQLGGKIDGRSDIYSLGVILYRMLSGQLPFQSGSLSDLVQMQLVMMPAPLRSLRPETPAVLDELVMQMLAKNQEQRPASALEVAQRYDQALGAIGEANTLNWAAQAPTLLQDSGRSALPPPPLFQRTESLPNAPTPRRFEVKAGQTANAQPAELPSHAVAPPRRSLLAPGVLLGAALAGGSLMLYRYGFDAGANSRRDLAMTLTSPTPLPTPSVTVTPTPKPSRPVSEVKTRPAEKKATPTPTPSPTAWPGPPRDFRFGTPPDRRNGRRPGFGEPRVSVNGRPSESPSPAEREQFNRQFSQQQLSVARQLYQKGLYKGALRSCEQALRLDPNNTEAATLQKKIREAVKILNDKNEQ
ncbi:MAG: protein kinase [Acidobacteria bacterium]|nr:protein kinase [Acidobacteriota bacterium]MBI3422519.1 protein kinase [Acidobacteriota bacterium]